MSPSNQLGVHSRYSSTQESALLRPADAIVHPSAPLNLAPSPSTRELRNRINSREPSINEWDSSTATNDATNVPRADTTPTLSAESPLEALEKGRNVHLELRMKLGPMVAMVESMDVLSTDSLFMIALSFLERKQICVFSIRRASLDLHQTNTTETFTSSGVREITFKTRKPVTALAFMTPGILAFSEFKHVTALDLNTEIPLFSHSMHDAIVLDILRLPHSNFGLSLGFDHCIKIWDVGSGCVLDKVYSSSGRPFKAFDVRLNVASNVSAFLSHWLP